jgi:hypothetical protein
MIELMIFDVIYESLALDFFLSSGAAKKLRQSFKKACYNCPAYLFLNEMMFLVFICQLEHVLCEIEVGPFALSNVETENKFPFIFSSKLVFHGVV